MKIFNNRYTEIKATYNDMKGDKARENYFTATFYIPLIENEIENEVFLNQTAYIFQNIFFYDDAFRGENWQLFTT